MYLTYCQYHLDHDTYYPVVTYGTTPVRTPAQDDSTWDLLRTYIRDRLTADLEVTRKRLSKRQTA
jgi:hypothetical protein